MTKDQYLRMCEQTGEEIDWEKCPPDLEDFPESIYTALNIYHSMGSRVQAEIGYIGKDFTNLSLLYKFYYIEEYEKEKGNKKRRREEKERRKKKERGGREERKRIDRGGYIISLSGA